MRRSPTDGYLADLTPARRLVVRLRRQWQWGRTWGWANVLEEHDADPVERVVRAARKWAWRHHQGGSRGDAVPIFVVGAQRSGTNMLVKGLARAPEVEVHNEGDRRAFELFRLRPDPVLRAIVERSRHRCVLFKPLCDSHRVDHLLDGLGTKRPGKAVWAYRDFEGRVRSAVAHFGASNLTVFRDFVAGRADHRWQVQRLSPESLELVRSLDYERLTPASGAALFWYVRNRLYFELGLHERDDVLLVSYNDFLADPPATMGALCRFVGAEYRPALVAHMRPRAAALRSPLDLDPILRSRCEDLQRRLDGAVRDDGRLAR